MTWEERWHPLREEWVLVAAHRQNRPWSGETVEHVAAQVPEYVADCYLCPGNTRVGGARNDDYGSVFVFDNDHPCVGMNAPEPRSPASDVYRARAAQGIARVVCYSPNHSLALAELPVDGIEMLLRTWQAQYAELAARPEINHVLIFENKGEAVGVSNPHPHGQIYATNFVFKTIETEARASAKHLAATGRTLFREIIAAEQTDNRRIVDENETAISFMPYFARYAYETYVAPKRTHASIAELTDRELRDFALMLKSTLVRFDNLWRMPFPYVMVLHNAPTDAGDYGGFHFHIEFHPPLRRPNLLKYLAGPEIGGGNFLSDTAPEEKAAELRRAGTVHYKHADDTGDDLLDLDQTMTSYADDRDAITRAAHDAAGLLEPLRRLHEQVRDSVVAACESASLEQLSVADDSEEGDTIYAIDRVSEEVLLDFFERQIAPDTPIILIAEGIENGSIVLPRGTQERDAVWRVIVDPIDGTRGIMYQKRSAWVLTGVAPNRGRATNLSDIVLCVQTEIPLIKQHLSDVLWCVRGQGAHAERHNRITGERTPLRLQPSRSATIRHGFAGLARFFPGVREELAAIDEEVVRGALGDVEHGKAHCFEDQYLSSAGQLYELLAGHDRFIADLRPLMEPVLQKRGLSSGIACHPYDLCTELIARELGVIVTDEHGELLRAPLDVHADVAWCGYANDRIREEIEPLLQGALRKRGLL